MWRKLLSIMLAAGVALAFSSLALGSPVEAHRGGDGGGGHGHKVKMYDDCDPASFNAAVGPGACTGDGETTFDAFIAQLLATQQAEDWEFDPSMLRVRQGRPVILENEGGETHTFTLVDEFGGGFVPELNDLLGLEPVDECATHDAQGHLVPRPPSPVNVFVAADREGAFKTARLTPGTYRFECCIHPWMQVVLTVRAD